MPSIEAALTAELLADAGVTALVGDRIFPMGGRQGTAYPYVTYMRISTAGAERLDGPNTLEWPRFQIDCWAAAAPTGSALQALSVAEAIRLAIDNVPIDGDPAFAATFQDQSGPAPDEETRSFRVSQDYLVFHER